QVGNSASLNPTSQLSITAWVKADDWNGNRRIVQKSTLPNNDDQYRLLAEGGHLVFELTGVTGGRIEYATLPSVGVWHHVAGTYAGTTIKLYVDGVQVASQAATGQINTTTGPLFIGTKNPTAPPGDHFKGSLDEVYVFDRGLSAAGVQQNMQGRLQEKGIGRPGQGRSVAFANGVFTVKGGGHDIWDSADDFHFVYQPLNGNGQVIARVTGVQNTDQWAKAGVMIRETLDASSRHMYMALTPGNGAAFQGR